MQIFVYDVTYVQCSKWNKELIAFGILSSGKTIAIHLYDFQPFLLTTSTTRSVSELKLYLNEDVEEILMTPLVGFTNSRKDPVMKIRVKNARNYYKIRAMLDPETVVHTSIQPAVTFLHETGLHLMSWWNVHTVSDSTLVFTTSRTIRTSYTSIKTVTDRLPIQLPIIYFRLHAKSLSSTSTNQFAPNASNDPIRVLTVFQNEIVHTFEGEEHTILTRFFNLIRPVIILAFCNDHLHDLVYVITRAKALHVSTQYLSFVPNHVAELIYKDERLLDISMPGKLRVDLMPFLAKTMVSPPLDGFTIRDGLLHPKLIKNKTSHLILSDLEYTVPFGTCTDINVLIQDLQFHLQALRDILVDNSVVIQMASLSNACDLNLSNVIERGQQARVRHLFFRYYAISGIYLNDKQLATPYVTIQKRREESHYAPPEWLENPPLESLVHKTTANMETLCIINDNKWHRMQNNRRAEEQRLKTNKRKTTEKLFSGGFVIEPQSGFYMQPHEAVTTLDFASLYPSIIQGYHICYQRVVYDRSLLDDPLAELEYIPMTDNICSVFVKSYNGVLVTSITDRIIAEIVKLRKDVRSTMKTMQQGSFEYESADARQLGCKVLQNATYGFLGSKTSGMLCTALAASVTNIGAYMNQRVRHLVLSQFQGRCVYGDTDSSMVQFPTVGIVGDDAKLQHIYQQAHAVEQLSKQMFPSPNAVEFEALKLPFLLLVTKKTYSAIQYGPSANSWKQHGEHIIKGLSFKKRDRCLLVQQTVKKLCEQIMSLQCDEEEILTTFRGNLRLFERSPTTLIDLQKYVITCRLADSYKSDTVLAVHLAQQIENRTGQKTRSGTRLPFVIIQGTELHYKRARLPSQAIGSPLDIVWYVETQLMRSVAQLLSLPVHTELLVKLTYVASETIKQHQYMGNTKLFQYIKQK